MPQKKKRNGKAVGDQTDSQFMQNYWGCTLHRLHVLLGVILIE